MIAVDISRNMSALKAWRRVAVIRVHSILSFKANVRCELVAYAGRSAPRACYEFPTISNVAAMINPAKYTVTGIQFGQQNN